MALKTRRSLSVFFFFVNLHSMNWINIVAACWSSSDLYVLYAKYFVLASNYFHYIFKWVVNLHFPYLLKGLTLLAHFLL